MLFAVAVAEERVVGRRLRSWSSLTEAAWYGFATLIGESITRDTSSDRAWALRVVCASWMVLAFVITSGYGGNLKAFLTTPKLSEPIDTIPRLLESGLPWTMVLYGEAVEHHLSTSVDPAIRRFWDGKDVIRHHHFPYEQMKAVYERKMVFVQYHPILRKMVNIGFTMPNGEKLIHIVDDLGVFPGTYYVWAFHPLDPWLASSFDPFLYALREAGLSSKWMVDSEYVPI